MDNYEYKRVSGKDVGYIAQGMSEGIVFCRHDAPIEIDTTRCGIFLEDGKAKMDLRSLRMDLNEGRIYTRTERPWWKGCGGIPVMASFNGVTWVHDCFVEFHNSNHLPFRCKGRSYQYARPLTAVERDAIKVEG